MLRSCEGHEEVSPPAAVAGGKLVMPRATARSSRTRSSSASGGGRKRSRCPESPPGATSSEGARVFGYGESTKTRRGGSEGEPDSALLSKVLSPGTEWGIQLALEARATERLRILLPSC
jgi:hypothetical protein